LFEEKEKINKVEQGMEHVLGVKKSSTSKDVPRLLKGSKLGSGWHVKCHMYRMEDLTQQPGDVYSNYLSRIFN
jgi:hypothetical protein